MRILAGHYWNESPGKKIERGRERKGCERHERQSWIKGNFPANDFVTEFHSAYWRGQPLKARPTKLGRSVSKRGMLRILTWDVSLHVESILWARYLYVSESVRWKMFTVLPICESVPRVSLIYLFIYFKINVAFTCIIQCSPELIVQP